MAIVDPEKIKTKYYTEAIRYMDNAKETLKKAGSIIIDSSLWWRSGQRMHVYPAPSGCIT